jgi:hypothetical protein
MRLARALAIAASAFLAATAARADDARAVDALNAPGAVIKEESKSWKPVFDAYVAMSAPPEVKGGLAPTGIWPGMPEWAAVKAWAAANPGMGAALLDARKSVAFAMPYGRGKVPQQFVDKGVFIGIGDGPAVCFTDVAYLKPLGTIQAWTVAEMYRLGEEKRFDEAFDLGIACMRLLRQVADQHLLAEKTAAMQGLGDMASVQRDVLQTFLDSVPVETLERLARTGYPMIRAADAERLRRLDMPEGDRVLALALIDQVFDAQGQPDPVKFAAAMAAFQARREPMGTFGATRRWAEIAKVHASADATRAKLTNIYDDWWRRWRAGYYDKILDFPTVISKTNPVRSAMVLAVTADLTKLFAMRQWLNAELNGTSVAFGVAAAYRKDGRWPPSISATYAVPTLKRIDFDPWKKEIPRWSYELADSPRTMDTAFGPLQVSGGIIYAIGADREDGIAKKASADGQTGDFVAWPALRAVSRGATTK